MYVNYISAGGGGGSRLLIYFWHRLSGEVDRLRAELRETRETVAK